ncbi:membrane protein [Vibrio inusitatus NBRC 102082]|uniref:Membrane protein n=1 Tax=Vibrio inusitatus NBRC 102082 TaxID=1219070 RepID=A0A4Y3HSU0_9VIBR|nr:outer membrane beta-barrel protein [Vibrio inusitatus]GEA50156.1 membrane protein [Vibrio inusitatus NBRC 102082]
MKYVKHALAIGLMSVSSMAAADSWLYAGGAVGQSSFGSDDNTTFGLHVGTGILPIIGIEAGYWNHGKFKFSGLEYDADSFYVGIKPSVDLGPVHIYGRLGANRYDLSGKAGTDSDDGYDLMYGVGVEYFIIDMISVGAGYQNFEVGDAGNIDSFTLNATFHFL